MAQVSVLSQFPPTPPPAVYSQVPNRSQSPQILTPPNESTNYTNFYANATAGSRPISRRTASAVSKDSTDKVHMSQLSESPVREHHPSSRHLVETYAAPIERKSQMTDQDISSEDTGNILPQSHGHDRLSPSPPVVPRRAVWQERNHSTFEYSNSRVSSQGSQLRHEIHEMSSSVSQTRQMSASTEENEVPAENVQPLQYHHQAFDDDLRAVDNRTSKLTLTSVNPDGSAPYESRIDPPVSTDLRHSMYGRSLQRPDSGFSSTSDLRGRTRSPQLSPNNHARAVSAHSRSPDIRPLSYVDLLNVPYPQPPPSGAENLFNVQLRASVGTNASLLSTRRTLEMYRANVKKSTDPAIQYEFAVFLISAAQEASHEDDEVSLSGVSGKSSGSVQGDLLKEAKHILQRLADRSYPFAQYYLADGLFSGLFNKGKEDYDRAFPLFLAASKHGHAEASYRTALCYEFGWGCRVDAAKAVQFYQHAASKKHPGAMLRLGRGCLMGDMGLTKRYKEGIRWLKRAAEDADFQYNSAPYELGTLHETGYGDDIFQDLSYTAQLFTKSADLSHKEANYRLGHAYEHGKLNCPRDPALSIHFYTGAAQQDHPQAQLALCAWYMIGVESVLDKDENEAYEWAKRSAEGGYAKAEYTVGYFTEMGIGCRRDPLEANVWYVRAADHGEDRAKHRIAAIRAAATGADPVTAAAGKKGLLTPSTSAGNIGPAVGERNKKRFGIF